MPSNVSDLKSIQAEAGIIATLLYNPTFVFHSENLSPRDFSDVKNGCLYWGLRELAEQGTDTIDAFILSNILSSNKAVKEKIEQIPIKSLHELFDLSADVARSSINEYKLLVDEVLDLSIRRQLYHQTQRMSAACLNVKNDGSEISTQIYQLTEEVMQKYAQIHELKSFGEKLDEIWADIERQQNGDVMTVPFVFPALNDYVQIEEGELVLFSAYAKVGKSVLLLTETVDLMRRGKCVVVVDSELTDKLYTLRLVSHVSKVPIAVVKSGNYDASQKRAIEKARAWIKEQKLYHFYLPEFSASEVLMLTKRVNVVQKIDVLVMDYFKNTSSGNAYDVSNALGLLVDMVKNQICGGMHIAGLGACQSDRDGNVALSQNIVRNASTLVSITRKDNKDIASDGEQCGNTKMQVRFNRNGAAHTEDEYIDMDFVGDILTIKQADEQHEVVTPY